MALPRTGMERIGALLAVLAFLLPAASQAQDARQYKLEAAFLYNFFNYITWPGQESPDGMKEAVICIEQDDPLENALAYVQHRMAAQRTLRIRAWNGSDAKGCHVLFVRSGARLPSQPGTLTVSEGKSLRSNAMVALEQADGRIGMRIDNGLLNTRGFAASSRLLSLAQEVK